MSDSADSTLNDMPINDLLLAVIRNEGDKNLLYSKKDLFSALQTRLPAMSVTELLRTFLTVDHGEFLSQDRIFALLREKSHQHIGDDIALWVGWFLGLSEPLDEIMDMPSVLAFDPNKDREKLSIALRYMEYKSERKFAEKIKAFPLTSNKDSELHSFISSIIDLETLGDLKAALARADELIEKYPGRAEAWAMRSHVHMLRNDFAKAVADITHAIQIDPRPPLLISRGQYYYKLGDYESALNDFNKLLSSNYFNDNASMELFQLSQAEGLLKFGKTHKKVGDYYTELFHLWRTEILLKLGRKQEALTDLSHVSDGNHFTYKLRTKSDLLADCNRLPD